MEPWKGSHVQQNEYIIWAKKDKHAQAYSKLSNERSKRIVANLGLKAATATSFIGPASMTAATRPCCKPTLTSSRKAPLPVPLRL